MNEREAGCARMRGAGDGVTALHTRHRLGGHPASSDSAGGFPCGFPT